MENGKQEQKDFVLQLARVAGVWWQPSYLEENTDLQYVNPNVLVAEFFDIPQNWYDRSRGQNQKLTYRTNRFSSAFTAWNTNHIFVTKRVGEKLLFSFDVGTMSKLFPYQRQRWFLSANSEEEATVLFDTMVLVPLGKSTRDRGYRGWDVRCHGLAKWFDHNQVNSEFTENSTSEYNRRKKELEEHLRELEKQKTDADLKIAILNQFQMFMSDES